MKYIYITAVLFLFTPDVSAAGGAVIKTAPEPEVLFVINFDTGSFDGKKLTLNGNGLSNVIYFSDRPERVAGHMGVNGFLALWAKGSGSLEKYQPKSVLSLFINNEQKDYVLTVSNPVVNGTYLVFDAVVIDGGPPESFNTGGLFMDGFPDGFF